MGIAARCSAAQLQVLMHASYDQYVRAAVQFPTVTSTQLGNSPKTAVLAALIES